MEFPSTLRESFCDVFVFCEDDGKVTEAHRIILAAKSEFFRDLLNQSIKEPKPTVTLKGITTKCFRKVLDYIYGEKLEAEDLDEEVLEFIEFLKLPTSKEIETALKKKTEPKHVPSEPEVPLVPLSRTSTEITIELNDPEPEVCYQRPLCAFDRYATLCTLRKKVTKQKCSTGHFYSCNKCDFWDYQKHRVRQHVEKKHPMITDN